MSFKNKYSLKQRVEECNKIIKKYPDKVPIICEKDRRISGFDIDKKKYLVSRDLLFGQFIFIIRQKLDLNDNIALFLIINNKIIPSNTSYLGTIYDDFKDMDGYLYITYSFENVFG